MTTYDNTNRGALFKNDRRENDNHPTHTGTINVGGVEYWLSAWVKEGQKGRFFSLAVKPKEQAVAQQRRARPIQDDLNDEIPF